MFFAEIRNLSSAKRAKQGSGSALRSLLQRGCQHFMSGKHRITKVEPAPLCDPPKLIPNQELGGKPVTRKVNERRDQEGKPVINECRDFGGKPVTIMVKERREFRGCPVTQINKRSELGGRPVTGTINECHDLGGKPVTIMVKERREFRGLPVTGINDLGGKPVTGTINERHDFGGRPVTRTISKRCIPGGRPVTGAINEHLDRPVTRTISKRPDLGLSPVTGECRHLGGRPVIGKINGCSDLGGRPVTRTISTRPELEVRPATGKINERRDLGGQPVIVKINECHDLGGRPVTRTISRRSDVHTTPPGKPDYCSAPVPEEAKNLPKYGTEPCIPNYSTESRPTLKQAREEACSSSAVLPGTIQTSNAVINSSVSQGPTPATKLKVAWNGKKLVQIGKQKEQQKGKENEKQKGKKQNVTETEKLPKIPTLKEYWKNKKKEEAKKKQEEKKRLKQEQEQKKKDDKFQETVTRKQTKSDNYHEYLEQIDHEEAAVFRTMEQRDTLRKELLAQGDKHGASKMTQGIKKLRKHLQKLNKYREMYSNKLTQKEVSLAQLFNEKKKKCEPPSTAARSSRQITPACNAEGKRHSDLLVVEDCDSDVEETALMQQEFDFTENYVLTDINPFTAERPPVDVQSLTDDDEECTNPVPWLTQRTEDDDLIMRPMARPKAARGGRRPLIRPRGARARRPPLFNYAGTDQFRSSRS